MQILISNAQPKPGTFNLEHDETSPNHVQTLFEGTDFTWSETFGERGSSMVNNPVCQPCTTGARSKFADDQSVTCEGGRRRTKERKLRRPKEHGVPELNMTTKTNFCKRHTYSSRKALQWLHDSPVKKAGRSSSNQENSLAQTFSLYGPLKVDDGSRVQLIISSLRWCFSKLYSVPLGLSLCDPMQRSGTP